jgi:hypothetical protein
MIGETTCEHCGIRFRASVRHRLSNYLAKFPYALATSLVSIAVGGEGVVNDPDPLVVLCPNCDHLTYA